MIYVDGILLYTQIETCNFVPNNSQVETEILIFFLEYYAISMGE